MDRIIAIDGPSASGKGTVALQVAQQMGWHILPSGKIYRAIAVQAKQKNIERQNQDEVIKLITQMDLKFVVENDELHTYISGKCVDEEIGSDNISEIASQIAVYPELRQKLMGYQRSFIRQPGLVAEGRDMGTVVFPEAGLKIYLNASIEQRAIRRLKQFQNLGDKYAKIDDIIDAITKRDESDRNRATAPLKQAEDAVVVDSTDLTINQTVEKIMKMTKERFNTL